MKNNSDMMQEKISAFADGELCKDQADAVLASLREPENAASWNVYHQIGDVMRSDDMAVSLSDGFAARMAARLEAEPTIIAPALSRNQHEGEDVPAGTIKSASMRRVALPAAAAAVAAIAFIISPQLLKSGEEHTLSGTMQATAMPGINATPPTVLANNASLDQSDATGAAKEIVLRDPDIDAYLLAHQRFSPSLNSTAQFARSANFDADTDNK